MQEAYLLTYEIKINLPLTKRFEMREFLFCAKVGLSPHPIHATLHLHRIQAELSFLKMAP